MADKNFSPGTVIDSPWLNDVNDNIYDGNAAPVGTLRNTLADATSSTKGDALLGVKAPFANATSRTQDSKNADARSIFDWMTPAEIADVKAGTGAVNVLGAMQRAHADSKSIIYEEGLYDVGTVDSSMFGGHLINFFGRGDGIQILSRGNVKFRARVSAGVVDLFYFSGNNNVVIGDFEFEDPTYVPVAPVTGLGLRGVTLENSGSQTFGNYKIGRLTATTIKEPFAIGSFLPRTGAITGIDVDLIVANNCYYGYNGNNDGNDVNINIRATNCFRPLFVYGCRGVTADVYNTNNRSTTAAINISRGTGGPATEDIHVKYFSRDCTQDITHVLINHIDVLGGTINGVTLDIDIEQSVTYDPVRVVTYTAAGGVETATPTNNIVNNVKLKGKCDLQARAVTTTAVFNTKYLFELDVSQYLYPSAALAAQFMFGIEFTYTPTWTCATTPPALGTGFLQGWYRLTDQGVCSLTLLLQPDGTTTYGTGEWSFSLPFPSKRISVGNAVIRDATGPAYYVGQARIAQGASTMTFALGVTPPIATGPTGTVPMTWANQDRLEVQIDYYIGQ